MLFSHEAIVKNLSLKDILKFDISKYIILICYHASAKACLEKGLSCLV